MTDIKLVGGTGQPADISIVAGDIAVDSGLENAVLLSLFLDRRADDDDVLPEGETDRRGWWGDEFLGTEEEEEDPIGSKLWLISREKQTDDLLPQAEGFAEESLEWMVDDTIAKSVSVTASFSDEKTILLDVQIVKADDEEVGFRYNLNWKTLEES